MNIPLLNQAVTRYDNELFPFAVMPMLPFCDARFTDINTDLTTVQRMQEFRKAPAGITSSSSVHTYISPRADKLSINYTISSQRNLPAF